MVLYCNSPRDYLLVASVGDLGLRTVGNGIVYNAVDHFATDSCIAVLGLEL